LDDPYAEAAKVADKILKEKERAGLGKDQKGPTAPSEKKKPKASKF